MKILITGSHFTPAQAVIEQLKKYSGTKLVYVGRIHTREGDKSVSVESKILPTLGVKFISLTTGRLQRSFTVYTIFSLLKIPIGFIQSFWILLQEKPDVVLSFGGYVAVPVVISAWVLSIPIIIHEQTLVIGLANKISSFFASKVAVSFPKNGAILTGNPIRQEVLEPNKKNLTSSYQKIIQNAKLGHLPLILITGGNQGSHLINQTVLGCLNELTKIACVIHQTGDSKFQDFVSIGDQQKTLEYPDRFLAQKWIEADELGKILREIDLVISRAGINSLLELAFVGIPTLAVPIPYVSYNEQNINAKFFADLGLVTILPQKDLTPQNLVVEIKKMIKQIESLKKKAQSAKKVVISDAAQRLALETTILAKS
ncbi:UDP-N-acetylglucosamine--N-acetylmuramyl-(pentapeptide) pyrophosphoryl-undecaprenol N-acetylglucosamine transferase [Candidatus Daviesbacteria bacterium]|nr:UDP-N-acetylglucosamine--N-acetylmuramyl-(pentapeptide) pyrophosphoryl-undecaprenol N-acetylglucosamine transferase [Candidatus Daviesbacteria bacterium]